MLNLKRGNTELKELFVCSLNIYWCWTRACNAGLLGLDRCDFIVGSGWVWIVIIQVTETVLKLRDEVQVFYQLLCFVSEESSDSFHWSLCVLSAALPLWCHCLLGLTTERLPFGYLGQTWPQPQESCTVFLAVRSWGWLLWWGQCSRIMLVDQGGQLKNSLKYPRDMYLFCIVFERINIPKPWCQKRELYDFYKTGHAAS